MRKLFILTLSILFVFPLVVFSGTTGKLTGVVIDSETKSPLPGANVMIDGTIFGAATDLEGNYIIINVPPGIYKVKAMMMGYTTTNITNVSVNVNLTSTVNFELKPTVLEMGEEVTIVADRELIQKDITSSRAIIGAEQIKEMPVENFRQVLELQAGVVQGSGGEMHVRGGRSSEVTYLVDGISVTDPYSSSMAVSVENSAIQELELVSGTFNAEYGQAMSGIVNIITKEGGKKYSGELRSYFGDYFSTNKNLYLNIDEIDPFSILDTQGSLSGPVPFTNNKLTFFASGRHYNTDGYLYGIRRYSPSDSNSYPGEDPADWILNETGTGEFVPMSKYYKTTGQLKLAYNFKPSMKLTYNTLLERAQSKSYSHGYKYNPDGRPTSFKNAMNQIFTWTHTLSPMTFYSLKYSNIYNHGQSYVYADPLDSKYVDPKRFDRSRSYQFYMGGVSMGQYDRSTTTNIFKLEFTSQINKVHQIRAGAEYRWNKLFLNSYSLLVDQSTNWLPVIPDVTMLSHDRYTNYPRDFSCYIQDKIELKDLVLNAGLRFDYLLTGTDRYTDPLNLILNDANFVDDESFEEQGKYFIVSPRLGWSFPVTDKTVFHAQFGKFVQMPRMDDLYDGHSVVARFLKGGNARTMPNPNLKPQQTIQYEAGLKQQIGMNASLNLTVFYKDTKDLIQIRKAWPSEGLGYAAFYQLLNVDYGTTKGFTVSLNLRRTNRISAFVDYTYSKAMGTGSDSRSHFDIAWQDIDANYPTIIMPLAYNQDHVANFNVDFRLTKDDGPTLFGIKPLANLGINVIYLIHSGSRYTRFVPGPGGGLDGRGGLFSQNAPLPLESLNASVMPWYYRMDMKIDRSFHIGQFRFKPYVWIYNVLNRKNVTSVHGQTGEPQDNGWFQTEDGKAWAEKNGSRGMYYAMYKLSDGGRKNLSTPRIVRFGLMVEF